MNQPDEFYIGWEAKSAPGIGRTVRKVVVGLWLLALLVPAMLAVSQRMIGTSVFEWGTRKSFSGILQTQPYPYLLVSRPGNADGQSPYSTYYLVAPWKFGLDREAIAPLDGKSVTLKGTLIYRGNQTMIETKPEWIAVSSNSALVGTSRRDVPAPAAAGAADAPLNAARTAQRAVPTLQSLGRQTLVGEIVDSKCFLGVMNPGQLTPHRACAIRCISGGCPPVLLVRQQAGPAIYLLLVSAEGGPVNKQVLDMVAEPVEITGEVERQGDLLILRADPATYRRIK
jgi:hypothetical protein